MEVGVGDERGSKDANEPEIRRIPAMVLLLNKRRVGEIGVCGRSPSLDEVEPERDGPALEGAG